MVPCVVLLSIDKKTEGDSDNDLSVDEMKKYGVLAVIMGLCGPLCWTIKANYVR